MTTNRKAEQPIASVFPHLGTHVWCGDPPNAGPYIVGELSYNSMIINESPYYNSYNYKIKFQFIIKWWKYNKLIFFKDKIEKKNS